MNSLRFVPLAMAGLALLAPLALSANPPGQPADTPPPREEAQTSESRPDGETAGEDKRICRYVKVDASSRRKTKVCRTVEEWRDLNNPR